MSKYTLLRLLSRFFYVSQYPEWACSYMSRWIMWVTKGQQKCLRQFKSGLNGIKEHQQARHWKALRSVWGWMLRAHWGPRGAKHKGPISCSQHKQNGHGSSSVALTYRFSHFTDSPTLRIIIRHKALDFKGINRFEHMYRALLSSLDKHVTLLHFLQYSPTKYLFSLLTCISAAAGALSFNHNTGCALRRAAGLWYAADWDNNW